MTTGKTQTVVSVNRSCYNYSHRNVETSTCCRFLEDGSTDYDETFRYYGGWLPGGEYRRCDDVIYYRYIPHFFPKFFNPQFFSQKRFPAKIFYPQKFFPQLFFPKISFPQFLSPKFCFPKFFPQIFDRHFFTYSLFPTSKNSYHVICVAHDIVVCVGAIILLLRNQGGGWVLG